MAENSDNQEKQENTAQPAKKTRKRATKKATQKAPVKEPAKEKSQLESFDRSTIGEKIRVFSLAKALGLPSKDVVIALNGMGLVKVAQSTLTRAEALQLIDTLQGAAADPNVDSMVPEDVAAEADEKIRERVRKDVENEIHQIEAKVDSDLASHEDDSDDSDVVDDVDDEPLSDITPEITPAPAEDTMAEAYAPVFKAPERSERRRARRTTDANQPERENRREANNPSVDEAVLDNDAADQDLDSEEAQPELNNEPVAIKGSSRLEAQRRRTSERRAEGRKRSRIVSQAEFLARRESVERSMIVRERERHDHHGRITQVGVLEDGLLVEHFVTSDENNSMIGNIYLGRVQNVLPSMEAAFIDIGQGRNGVLYAGEVDWKAAGLGGRSRKIEHALKSGDQVVVQVTKDPVGHKGARLTTQISLAGRYLVYVPRGRSAGISRKLPAPERKRLKDILNNVVPGKGGAIIRTAAEGVSEEAIAADVNRLHTQWEAIQEQAEKEKSSKGAKPVTLYEEPNMLVKVIRDLFNEDFKELIVDGNRSWNVVHNYVDKVAPDLSDRLVKFDRSAHGGADAFEEHRVDEQLQKALGRKVWLPSGGTLVIDRTEAMTVIDVNTGKFTGSGGSLEETVTSNNLEAAEEIVRQMRLRDMGGMIIVDFIDMILPENQELVLRRLKEALGRDRTRHQVSEVTSLGLVQMTRKRLGTGLLETFSTECECCGGRGIIIQDDPVEHDQNHHDKWEKKHHKSEHDPSSHPAAVAMHSREIAPETQSHEEQQNRESSRETAEPAKDFEALADSVIGITEPDSEPDSEQDSASESSSEESTRRGSKRRGRRGRGRGKGRTNEQVSEKTSEVTEDQALDDDSAGVVGEGEKSFDQAVAEFESSPRRKRKTRGNSRSDHRPRQEDFVKEVKEVEEVAEPEPVQAAPKRSGQPVVEKVLDTRTSGSSRGRRRAVRRTTPVETAPAEEKTEVKTETSQGSEQSRGRGRRRATRRSSQS
ncbi:translation initiation factor IF-2 N-terminal domain-containing protein [Corynebacterium sp. S7]